MSKYYIPLVASYCRHQGDTLKVPVVGKRIEKRKKLEKVIISAYPVTGNFHVDAVPVQQPPHVAEPTQPVGVVAAVAYSPHSAFSTQ